MFTVGERIGVTPEARDVDIVNTVFNHPTFFGIELELEGWTPADVVPRNLLLEGDGSLRNGGVEIKFKKPLRGRAVESVVKRLDAFLKASAYTTSERCSTHIHMDVTDMPPQQVVNLLLLSAVLEPLMFKLFGSTRTSNVFCMSTDMGGSNYSVLVKAVQDPEMIMRSSHSKYSAVGLFRLQDLGTVEYRMFHPIVKSEDYMRILMLLSEIKRIALMSDIREIFNEKQRDGLVSLFNKFFPEMMYDPEYEALLERGVRVVNDILLTADTQKEIASRVATYESIISQAKEQIQSIRGGI